VRPTMARLRAAEAASAERLTEGALRAVDGGSAAVLASIAAVHRNFGHLGVRTVGGVSR
jgi:hypothetical protein